jgi:cyclophilin family peptidyl-prolyl cis-trans isomerase
MQKTWMMAGGAVLLVTAGWAQQGSPPAKTPAAGAVVETRSPGLYMTFETSMGNIPCKLYEQEAPVTVERIVGLATGRIGGKRYYDGITFHRVIPQFMIQTGDPTATGSGGPTFPGFPFKDEFAPSLKFDTPGRLAMANPGRAHQNGSQFFITEVPTPHLDNRHTIFGDCSGASVVRRIARVPTNPANNKPATPVILQRVVVERVGPAPANAPEKTAAAPAGKATGPAKAPGKGPAKTPAKKTP